jgi:hypothetical protein
MHLLPKAKAFHAFQFLNTFLAFLYFLYSAINQILFYVTDYEMPQQREALNYISHYSFFSS